MENVMQRANNFIQRLNRYGAIQDALLIRDLLAALKDAEHNNAMQREENDNLATAIQNVIEERDDQTARKVRGLFDNANLSVQNGILILENTKLMGIIKAGFVLESPNGEHWHLAAALASLVKERDKAEEMKQIYCELAEKWMEKHKVLVEENAKLMRELK